MKKNNFKEFIKKRNFRYSSGRILIKSDTKLSRQQREGIFNIVRKNIQNPYYGCDQQIPREIFHKFEGDFYSVKFYTTRFRYLVKVKSSATN